jgi:hypothetical protein
MAESSRIPMHPTSEQDRQLVRNELTELLKTVQFANSKRYPALLSYVVEKALAGQSDELKERVLGIEVFNRPADYDTNNDTVVRVAAGEVRKRLALVYHESEVEHAIQITLPVGSYVPEFFRTIPQEIPVLPISVDAAPDQLIPPPAFEDLTPSPPLIPVRSTWWKPGARLALVVLAAGFVALFVHLRAAASQTSVDLFWQPVHASPGPVLICPGALVRSPNTATGMAVANSKDDYPYTSIATTIALAKFVDLFSKDQIAYIVQPTSSTTLTDMREHPVILIGAYNNEWTERLQNDLRYRFATKPDRKIYDEINPSTTWTRPSSLPLREEDDYAIVGRFHSKLTDNLVVLIAGIGKNGTEAASQFVTTPRYMDMLDQRSKDWASKNMEVVLKIKVVDGKSGAPSIEAMCVW